MKGRLFVLAGPEIGRSYDLRHADTLGRGADCIITLRHASVSRRHARIELRNDAFWIVDDGSRNGIHASGARVEQLELTDHLEFALGELMLRFRVEGFTARAEVPVPEPVPEPQPERRTPTPPPAAEVADWDDGITIEEADEIELAPARGAAAPATPLGAPQPEGRRILQYHKVANERGFAVTDLSQHPVWVRWSVYALAVAVTVALFLVSFKGTSFLRSQARTPPAAEAQDR